MTTTASTQPLAIADTRYLWSEVERLKSHVHSLQLSERHAREELQRLTAYVATFVTHPQLDAALCTTMSPTSVAASLDRTRAELLAMLEQKADAADVQTLHTKKLDISVYDASAWNVRKFRTTLEQSVRDLFAQFAHQIEKKVSMKLSIDDFDRMFNPNANGHKAALESAAERIARMNHQLDTLEEYVQADYGRQQKLVDLDTTVEDLTHKASASQLAIDQLLITLEHMQKHVQAVENNHARTRDESEDTAMRASEFQERIQADLKNQQQALDAMCTEIDGLTCTSQQTTATLAQIQQFTQNTLLKGVDAKLKQITQTMERALGDAGTKQQAFKQQTTQQVSKATERVLQSLDHQAELERRVCHAEAIVASVRDDVAAIKGPLVTVARNLREENVAILEEIRRSQDESREILIDYKGLLEKDTAVYGHPVAATLLLPSRPASSTAAAVSRKYRQQHIHALTSRIENAQASNNCDTTERVISRPHTSNGRLGVSPTSRPRSRTASTYGTKSTASPSSPYASPRAAATAPVAVEMAVPPRPKSEASARPKKASSNSILHTIGASGLATAEELFLFPPCTSGDITDHPASKNTKSEPQQS